MRKTDKIVVYPINLGLDKTSMPGVQNRASITDSKNVVLKNNGSKRKRQGVVKIPVEASPVTTLRGVEDFHATTGSGRFQEIVRVVDGRVEALRDNTYVDLGVTGFTENDRIVFARFINALIIFFENRPPVYYLLGGTPLDVAVPPSNFIDPPSFGVVHNSRLCYAGRQGNPHFLMMSAIENFNAYTLSSGALGFAIKDGDGDPIGLTGLSPTFRGDLFAFKSQALYRIYNVGYTYGIDQVTDQVGCVEHNTIVATQNDLYWVSDFGIHSLSMTANYGATEESIISAPIFEYFQEDVNWNASKYMKATYDRFSNSYLLAYPSQGSFSPNKVLGFNISSRQFFEWSGEEMVWLSKYNEPNKRTRTLVGFSDGDIGYLDENETLTIGRPTEMSFTSSLMFPLGDPSRNVDFTKGKIYVKPTEKDVFIDFTYFVDNKLIETKRLNLNGRGDGLLIEGSEEKDLIGVGQIIGANTNLKIINMELVGEGSSFYFTVNHAPPVDDPDQACEIYGFYLEFDYNEDTDNDVNT